MTAQFDDTFLGIHCEGDTPWLYCQAVLRSKDKRRKTRGQATSPRQWEDLDQRDNKASSSLLCLVDENCNHGGIVLTNTVLPMFQHMFGGLSMFHD